VAEEVPLLRV